MVARRKKVVVLGVVVVGLVVIVAAGVTLQRPVLEGWYLRKLDSEDENERKLAAEKLMKMASAKAIPKLIHILQSEQDSSKFRITLHGDTYEIVASLPYTAEALIGIGATAVPDLIQALNVNGTSDSKSTEIVYILSRIGPEACDAIPVLVEIVERRDLGPAFFAAHALGEIGPKAKSAVPALTKAQKIEHRLLRIVKTSALKKIRGE